jgi:malonyl-CoA O-methyltransferase
VFRGIFVTGTDTGVGKTVVSAALMLRYCPVVPSLRYWKPVQTGIERDDDTATVENLSGAGAGGVLADGIRLRRPVSPHLAARLSGTRIAVAGIVSILEAQPPGSWIVEGAGGVLVPLNESELIIDLMAALGLPVVVAASAGLGTINHTLLTLEALRVRTLTPAGVVLVGPKNPDNCEAIEKYGRVPVIGELPHLEPLTGVTLSGHAERLDRDGVLAQWLT